MDKNILDTPDDSGWHFFKKGKKGEVCVVYINEDGIGLAMDEKGKTWEIEDFIGRWEQIEPQFI